MKISHFYLTNPLSTSLNINLPNKGISPSFVETQDDNILNWRGYYFTEKSGKQVKLDSKPNTILTDATCRMATNTYRGLLKIMDFKELNYNSSLKLVGGAEIGKIVSSITGESVITVNNIDDIYASVNEKNREIQTYAASKIKTEHSQIAGLKNKVMLDDAPDTHYASLAYGFAGLARYISAEFAWQEVKKVFPDIKDLGHNAWVLYVKEQKVYLNAKAAK